MSAFSDYEKAQLRRQVTVCGALASQAVREMVGEAIIGCFDACKEHGLDDAMAARQMATMLGEYERVLLDALWRKRAEPGPVLEKLRKAL